MTRCVLAIVLSLAAGASADLVQITASGPVGSSNMTAFPAGQTVTLVFTYESTGAPQFIQSQQAFYVDHWRSIHVTSGAYDSQYSQSFGQIVKYDNLGGGDGISFQAAANQATYQFTNPRPQVAQLASVLSNNITQAFANMYCNLASSSSTVWSDYTLPTTYDFSQFTQTRNMSFEFSNGSFQVGITSISSQVLPGPGGLALLGLGGMLVIRRRR